MTVKSDGTQLKHISFPPQQAVAELAKCNNHTKSSLLTSRGLWVITHLVRKANQAGGPLSYKQCPTKRRCLDTELQTVQELARCPGKLAEASKVSVWRCRFSRVRTWQGARIKQKSLAATNSALWSRSGLTWFQSKRIANYEAPSFPVGSCINNYFLGALDSVRKRRTVGSKQSMRQFRYPKCSQNVPQMMPPWEERRSSGRASQLQAVPHAAEVAWWFIIIIIIIDCIDLQTCTT